MGPKEKTIRPERSDIIRKAVIFAAVAAFHVFGFLYLLHVKYTYKIFTYPSRGPAVVILPKGAGPVPQTGQRPPAKTAPEKPRVIPPGKVEQAGGAERTASAQAQPGAGAAGRGGTGGAGAGAAAGGTVAGGQPGAGGGSGFRLVYRKGAPLIDLAKQKTDPLADLTRPERYRYRPDLNLSKYIRPNPLGPDVLPPGGGGRGGAAAAAVAAKAGPVAAIAATPAGGADVPDNVRRFDFRPWANEAAARIQKNWSLLPYGGGSWKGEVGILIMIAKSGEILGAEIKVSSNVELLDQVALSALRTSSPLPPLPEDFPNSSLEMYLVFKYGY